MGDVRFEDAYARVAEARDRARVLADLDDDEVIAALGAASRARDPLLANVLATEALNRMRRASVVARYQGEGALTTDAEGRCTFANREALHTLGVARAAIIGAPLAEVLRLSHPDGSPPAIADVVAHVLEGGATIRSEPLTLQVAEGRSLPITLTCAGVVVEGEPVGAVVTFRDISRLREQEEKLEEANRFLQATIDALPLSLAIVDASGAIVAVNRGWRAFAQENGLAWPDHGIGRDYVETCRQAGDPEGLAFADAIERLLASEARMFELEYPCHSPTEQRWFIGRVTRLEWEGAPHVIVSHLDITRRKLAELASGVAQPTSASTR